MNWKNRRKWYKIVSGLACIVVFCTVYALILPAVTLERPAKCGLEEHTHTEECYTDGVLSCEKKEHVHTEACYAVETETSETASAETETSAEKTEQADGIAYMDTDSADSDTNSAIDSYDGESIELKKYITKVTVQKKNSKDEWETSNTFQNGDQVRVILDFEIEDGAIHEGSRKATYHLPDGVKPNEKLTGRIKNNEVEVGDYEILPDGTINILYDEDFAEGGEKIIGGLQFEGTLSSDNTSVDKEIKFDGDDGNITIEKEKEPEKPTDINVKKSGKLCEDGENIEYTITIDTNNGTGKDISFTDWLTNAKYDSNSASVKKIGADQTESEVSDITATVSDESNGNQKMVISGLGELQAGEKYIVTYKAKADTSKAAADGKLDVTNNVDCNGTRSWNSQKVSDSVISKKGSYNPDTNKITWTIKVDPNGRSIKGATISDQMNGKAFTGDVTLKNDKTGEERTVRLPYTFNEDSKETYTITYVTDVEPDEDGNAEAVENTASYKKDDKVYTSKENITPGGRTWDVNKKIDSSKTEAEGGRQKYIWNSSVTLPNKAIGSLEEQTYTDTILTSENVQNEKIHYGTKAEIEAAVSDSMKLQYIDADGKECTILYKDNEQAFAEYFTWEVRCYGSDGNVVTDDNSKNITKFEVVMHPIESQQYVGKRIYFEYPTHGVTAGLDEGDKITFKNTAQIPTKKSEASVTYQEPKTMKKYSAVNGYVKGDKITSDDWFGSDSVTNGYESGTSKVTLGEDGLLYYEIILNLDVMGRENIQLKDILPEGVSYVEGSGFAKYCNVDSNMKPTGYFSLKLNQGDQEPSFSAEGQNLNITLPACKYSGTSYAAVFYAVKIDNPEDANGKTFKNQVEWKGEVSTDTETTVEKKKEILDKRGGQLYSVDSKDPDKKIWEKKLEYNVVINPDGMDLDENSDQLILTDTISEEKLSELDLDFKSVKLYTYDPNNESDNFKGQEIDASQYRITYDNSQTGKRILTLRLPDSMACVLSYQYAFNYSSNISASSIKISNEAKLLGKSSKKDDIKLMENSSSGHSKKDKVNITLYKVDSEDFSKFLQGAEFRLSSWHVQGEEGFEEQSGWKEHTPNLTTDQNGEIVFIADSTKTVGEVLRKNTIYKLTETKAPKGYSLSSEDYYFVWLPDDDVTLDTVWSKLTAEEQTRIGSKENLHVIGEDGGSIYITNKYTNIGVQKVWVDADGKVTSPGAENVQVQLMQSAKRPNGYHVTLNIYRGTPSSLLSTKEIQVKKGTQVVITDNSDNSQGTESNWSVACNGNNFGSVKWKQKDGSWAGTITITTNAITEDCTIDVKTTGWLSDDSTLDISYTEPNYILEGANTYGEPVTLSKANEWYHMWENLPSKDVSGNEVYYWVKEISQISGYTTSYDNNSGIQSGEIKINNKKNSKSPEYELPKTGGRGTTGYTLGGLLLMAAAGIFMYKQKSRRKEEKNFTLKS